MKFNSNKFLGVVKHIEDMVKESFPRLKNNLVLIGIAPWGVVSERDSLICYGVKKFLDNIFYFDRF